MKSKFDSQNLHIQLSFLNNLFGSLIANRISQIQIRVELVYVATVSPLADFDAKVSNRRVIPLPRPILGTSKDFTPAG